MFRFTIRDVLWLMVVVVALALGWGIEHQRFATTEHELRESYMQVAMARTDASYQALSYKQALEKAEAKLKAAEQGKDSN
jgi:hypothetical protein